MGSIARVGVHYVTISEYIKNSTLPIYAAVMNGSNIYTETMPQEAILVMGNEANGISDEIQSLVQNRITIPRMKEANTAESLNVATATAILLSEFKR
jgi:TrmH family RNA methyltransferase